MNVPMTMLMNKLTKAHKSAFSAPIKKANTILPRPNTIMATTDHFSLFMFSSHAAGGGPSGIWIAGMGITIL
eukprot:CAMPEP_0115748732 /NCGR_PEP_ID=MMETSP0272-20121206/93825_2 /TAXON_ID=71861 /ORGANISM="Scrippsiella trochoidea, Strain CCMP3099" /LENGTH=71 /DNA_ID=CAMNT_0003193755 /DNA_START=378 /DNA_END=590 /DNA_ORIENTATION=-